MKDHTKRPRSKQRGPRRKSPTLDYPLRLAPSTQTCVQIPLFVDDCPGCHLRRLAAPTNVPKGAPLPLLLCALHDPQQLKTG